MLILHSKVGLDVLEVFSNLNESMMMCGRDHTQTSLSCLLQVSSECSWPQQISFHRQKRFSSLSLSVIPLSMADQAAHGAV